MAVEEINFGDNDNLSVCIAFDVVGCSRGRRRMSFGYFQQYAHSQNKRRQTQRKGKSLTYNN